MNATRLPCDAADCDLPRYAKGYCRRHYQRFYRGKPIDGPFRIGRNTCTIEGCDGFVRGRGLCPKHYERWRAGIQVEDVTIEQRFQLCPTREAENGCVEWLGHVSGRSPGYGDLNFNGERYKAHRVAYEIAKGPIPEGFVIDHICHNTLCVNADHLRATTQHELRRSQEFAG